MVDHELRLRAHQLCSEHLAGAWRHVDPLDISVIQVSGGVSNLLYCCALPETMVPIDDEPTQVLLRLYGDEAKNNDIALQIVIFNMLSQKGLGPKLYGIFDDGRLEEFLPANSLTCDQLRNHDISLIIAKKLANIHSLDVPVDRQDAWLLDKLSEWKGQFIDLSELDQLGLSEASQEAARQLLAIDFTKEMDFLRQVLERTSSPMVFSHNDLHQGNILLAETSRRRPTLGERVILIDFEYCSFNYRAYDIANHFTEWVFEYGTDQYPHFNYFQDRFPSEMEQRSFIREYLLEQRKLETIEATKVSILKANNKPSPMATSGNSVPDDNNHRQPSKTAGGLGVGHTNANGSHASDDGLQKLSSNGVTELSETNGLARPSAVLFLQQHAHDDLEAHVDALYAEVQPFYMAVNLLWATWAMKNSRGSSIKFGYFEHAITRWHLYSKFKKLYPQMNSFQMCELNKPKIGWSHSIQTH